METIIAGAGNNGDPTEDSQPPDTDEEQATPEKPRSPGELAGREDSLEGDGVADTTAQIPHTRTRSRNIKPPDRLM